MAKSRMKKLDTTKLIRCLTKECGSSMFFDWGIELLTGEEIPSVTGGVVERWRDSASQRNVKVCVGCLTPYIIEAGDLVDVSEELTKEDIQGLLRMQQGSRPVASKKDP